MHVTLSCLTLCGLMDCSPSGSSVRGISQASILEWVAISSSRGSSQPSDQTRVSCISCIGRPFLFPTEPLRKPSCSIVGSVKLTAGEAISPCPAPFLKKVGTLSAQHQPHPTPGGSKTRTVIMSMCTAARDLHELMEWLEKEEGLT